MDNWVIPGGWDAFYSVLRRGIIANNPAAAHWPEKVMARALQKEVEWHLARASTRGELIKNRRVSARFRRVSNKRRQLRRRK